MINKKSIYRSEKCYATLMNYYDSNLRKWPVPYECLTIATRFGNTHVITCGSKDNPPVILMRGAGGNALLWEPDIIHLTRELHVYAVDVIGESGKSAPTRPSYKGPDYGDWMVDLLDGLRIERANLVGTSRGGWLTLKTAIHSPKRVIKIIPVSSEGIASVSAGFFMHMLPLLLNPNRRSIESLMRFLTPPNLPISERLVEERLVVYRNFKQSWDRPPLFTDEELRKISAPTLVLYGDHEVVYNLNSVKMRIAELPSNFHLEVLPDAGHVLDYDQTEKANRLMLTFLKESA